MVRVGRLGPVKGFDRLIRAFAAVAAAAPRLAAADLRRRPRAPALKALIAELGLEARVCSPGACATSRRSSSAASIFALSSRAEGLPLALLEAMSKGLAVVSFAVPAGPREVIEHGVDGLLVANGRRGRAGPRDRAR